MMGPRLHLLHILLLSAILILVAIAGSSGYSRKRIVGGGVAPIGAFPYMASLNSKSDNSHFCGGSIIEPSVILTAAHCLRNKNHRQIKVTVGSNTLNGEGPAFNVKAIRYMKTDDIGLLVLDSPIEFSVTVNPIALETDWDDGVRDCVASGWGRVGFGRPKPNLLRFVNLRTIPFRECRLREPKVTTKHICTLTRKGEGTCFGDSGGPLVANNKQIGIVSGGDPCATGEPDIYVRVSDYIEWIATNSKL